MMVIPLKVDQSSMRMDHDEFFISCTSEKDEKFSKINFEESPSMETFPYISSPSRDCH